MPVNRFLGSWMRELVTKETVVLRRLGVETNVWLYQQS